MKQSLEKMTVVFAVAALVTILVMALTACGHAETELGNALGCHLAGNGCPSIDPNDPNLRGPQGPAGPTGPQGQIGPGTPYSITAIVRFCPGQSTYPSAFPEIGFCIGGNIYAAYSANGGFLTLFPAGRYSSNAIGSQCSFTIQANCQVVP